jgi:hypothetical protein
MPHHERDGLLREKRSARGHRAAPAQTGDADRQRQGRAAQSRRVHVLPHVLPHVLLPGCVVGGGVSAANVSAVELARVGGVHAAGEGAYEDGALEDDRE